MTERELTTGKVARILNTRELAINRGSADGVREGMRFAVLDDSGEDIQDPDTGESLGSVVRPKVEVEVFSVEEHLALARTFKARRVNVGGAGLGGSYLTRAFEPPTYETRYETLKTEEKTWADLSEEESYVNTGDRVKEVTEDVEGHLADPPTLERATDA